MWTLQQGTLSVWYWGSDWTQVYYCAVSGYGGNVTVTVWRAFINRKMCRCFWLPIATVYVYVSANVNLHQQHQISTVLCLLLLSRTFDWCLATMSVQSIKICTPHNCILLFCILVICTCTFSCILCTSTFIFASLCIMHTRGFVFIVRLQYTVVITASYIHFHNHCTDCSLTELCMKPTCCWCCLTEEGKLRQTILVPRLIHHMYLLYVLLLISELTANHCLPVL